LSVALYYLDDDWEVASVQARTGTLELVTDANEGSVATSSVEIDDPDGTFEVRGLRPAWAIETAATSDDYDGILWCGFIGVREYYRGEHQVGAGRNVTIELHDLNEMLDRILMEGSDAKRSEESSNTRLAWLLATSEASFIEDQSFVSTATSDTMSEADYRGQKIRDILDDLGQQTGVNWWLWNVTDTGDNPSKFGLWYGKDDPTTVMDFSSSLKISNVRADMNFTTVFAPAHDTRLRRDPSRVFSGVHANGDGISDYVSRPQTVDDFGRRDGTFIAENVKSKTALRRRANRYLASIANEEDTIETAIVVPASLVNGVLAGMRMEVKYTHFTDYTSYKWMRVYSRTVQQLESGRYELRLRLVGDADGEVGGISAGAGACTATLESGEYYPLGGSGDTPNPSDGVTYYLNPGLGYPIEPEPGHQGHMHFATYGAGGTGTWDMPGSCCQNVIRVMVQGNGTLTIHTDPDVNDTVLTAGLWHHQYGPGEAGNLNSGVDVLDELQTGLSGGDEIVFDITTHGGQNCTHWVDVRDNGPGQAACGGGWGWKYQGATWESDD
jgi:hypothetical protein